MEYKLIADSCCELTAEMKAAGAESVPLTIMLDGVSRLDDDTFDVQLFYKQLRESRNVPKSACPAPEAYAEKFRKALNVFAVTLSSKLSGSYNSAVLGAQLSMGDHSGRRVHVFDSLSASAGQIVVCLKIKEYADQNMDFDTIVEKVSTFIDGMKTFFILENLDTLIKSGRMSRIVGYVASAMSLRPIMHAEGGEIKLFEKARGSVRAFARLVDIIGECGVDLADRTLVITHCNNLRQANYIKAEAEKRYSFKSIRIEAARGLTSMYANEGGVVIAF